MPKKKPIDKRINKLFDDIKQEEPTAEAKPAVRKRATEEKPLVIKPAIKHTSILVPTQQPITQTDTVMSLAFQTGQNNWATLQVMDETNQRKWSDDDQLLVKQVTDQLSLALENARLFQETQRRAQEMTALAQVGREISATLELQTVLEKMAGYAIDLLRSVTSAVYIPTSDLRFLNPIAVVGEKIEEIRNNPITIGEGILGYIAQSKMGEIVNDTHHDMRTVTVAGTDRGNLDEHIMAVPILLQDKLSGVMAVWRVGQESEYTQIEFDFLTNLAQQAAIAIENARLFQDVTESQGQLSEALRIARIGYFELDRNAQTVTMTDELFGLLNTTAKKEGGYVLPLNQTMEKYIFTEDIPNFRQALDYAFNSREGGRDIRTEIRYKTSDGKIIWISSTYKVERDKQGKPIKVVGSSQDITERKTNELIQSAVTHITESALTSKSMEDLIESIHKAISDILPAKNFYVALYDSGTSLITFPYLADEHDTEWSPRKLDKGLTSYVIRTGAPLRTTPEIFSNLEASGEIVNDGIRNVDWLGVPLRSKQVINGVVAIQTYDTTVRLSEQHKSILTVLAAPISGAIERFLAEREIQKFKLGIDRSDNAVFITDTEGVIQYANPAFEKTYGFPLDEVIGQTPRIIKSGIIQNEQYKQFWDTLLAGETVSGEIINKAKNGALIPISGTNSPILDETGKIIGFLSVQQDITDRKLSEELLKRRNDYLAASAEIGRLVTSTLDLDTIFTRTVNLISEQFGFYFAGNLRHRRG